MRMQRLFRQCVRRPCLRLVSVWDPCKTQVWDESQELCFETRCWSWYSFGALPTLVVWSILVW